MSHVPMCLICGNREVFGEFSYEDGTGFCSVECVEVFEDRGGEFGDSEPDAFADDIDRVSHYDVEVIDEGYASQYDDDPSPYDGTYSEE